MQVPYWQLRYSITANTQCQRQSNIWRLREYLLEFEMIDELVKIIKERKNSSPDKQYTSSLLSGGLDKCIDKLEEEFGELKKALNTKKNEIHEAADLLYHLLVALEAADVKFEDVLKELEKRKKQSGLEEKNNRS